MYLFYYRKERVYPCEGIVVIPIYFQNHPEDPKKHSQETREDQNHGEAKKYKVSICRDGSVPQEREGLVEIMTLRGRH